MQCCHFDIVILRVAAISNVQMSSFSVDTGRHQTTPPLVDGVVRSRLVQFTPHGVQTLAQLVDVLDSAVRDDTLQGLHQSDELKKIVSFLHEKNG